MRVLLLQLDGSTPNIALMRIAAHHRGLGDTVVLRQMRRPRAFDVDFSLCGDWDKVYGSLIFTKSQPLARHVLQARPDAVLGGTGWSFRTLEDHGIASPRGAADMDYSIYPNCEASLGFTQRGCRLDCGFCVVPKKEGKVHQVATIHDIWRGGGSPKHILLLDNDFFGQPAWRERVRELQEGGFRVSFNQGINARMLSDEAAAAIASVDYRDDSFTRRRIYTAWDNAGDEGTLFRGLRALVKYGVAPDHIMVYMLIGYWPGETASDRDARRQKLRDFGARPYPMPYVRTPELVGFQRWVIGAYDKRFTWQEWQAADFRPERLGAV